MAILRSATGMVQLVVASKVGSLFVCNISNGGSELGTLPTRVYLGPFKQPQFHSARPTRGPLAEVQRVLLPFKVI